MKRFLLYLWLLFQYFSLCGVQAIALNPFTVDQLCIVINEYAEHGEPITLYIDHDGTSFLSSILSWNNAWKALTFTTNAAFIAVVSIFTLIQLTYKVASRLKYMISFRDKVGSSKKVYVLCKRHRSLFRLYVSIDKALVASKMRHYFPYDQESNNIIHAIVDSIDDYEKRTTELR